MKTSQITLPEELLQRVDAAVTELDTNRSAFAREAFEEALFRVWVEKMEQQDEEAYRRQLQDPEEIAAWESIQEPGIGPGEWADFPGVEGA